MPHHTAAPPNAIPLWTDGLSIFTELPGPDGAPYVLRYPRTSVGLAQVLALITAQSFDALDRSAVGSAGGRSPPRSHAATQSAAREALAALGLTPVARRR